MANQDDELRSRPAPLETEGVTPEHFSDPERLSHEIAERKRMAAALEASARQWAVLFENAGDAVAILDDEARFVEVNSAMVELHGLPREQLVGRTFFGLVVPPGADSPQQIWAHFLQKGEARGEFKVERPDGSIRCTEYSATAGYIPGRHMAIVRDITARKVAEAERERLIRALEMEHRWLSAVIENSPVGLLLIKGPHGENVAANRRFEELFGGPFPSGTNVRGLSLPAVHPDGSPIAEEERPAIRALNGEQVRGEEFLMRRPGANDIPVIVSASPIPGPDGIQQGVAVVIEDLTSVKELERLREEWTSIIAHDLRQPVTGIYLFAQMLTRYAHATPEDIQSRAGHILSSAQQLNRMISDLTDASRLDTRKLEIVRQDLLLPDFMEGVLQRAAGVVAGRQVTLQLRGALPAIRADPGRLEQVLVNLLSNAVKYGYPETAIDIIVERMGDSVRLSVTNRGDGIRKEEFPSLFGRYRRARTARAGVVPGLGLGLYIARGLVEAHGGRLEVESVPGATTTFHVILPTDLPG